jgi:hypothetical protein
MSQHVVIKSCELRSVTIAGRFQLFVSRQPEIAYSVSGMADPNAVQNLCDALKAFALPQPALHTVYYDVAKDFQTMLAALLAVGTATCAALLTYRAAKLAYRGVTDQIQERSDGAARERDRRKLGIYLRLKSELLTFETFASGSANELKVKLDILDKNEPPIPEIGNDPLDVSRFLDAEERRTVTWKPADFPTLDALETAWNNIDLLPDVTIQPIDHLRRKFVTVKELWLLSDVKDGKISDITADLCRIEMADLANMSAMLIKMLEIGIAPLRKTLL